jgi:hypothetical protein
MKRNKAMKEYILKSALVAEVEKLISEIYEGQSFDSLSREKQVALWYVKSIMSSINTLEVKEVDFGSEVYKYIDERFNVYDDGNKTLQTKDKKSLIGMVDVENIAKHFFELGLKAQKGE